jgi:RNA polymerase sigma factor (sigma-70 family)
MDVVQSLLDSLLTDLRAGRLEFGSEDNLRTYLFRMSQRKVTDLLRRAHAQKRGGQQSTLSIGSEPEQLDPPGTDPTASVLARTAEVEAAIRRLAGPEDHQIWELRRSGQSWQDIGTLLGLTADAARKRHERLRLLLEQSLQDSSGL